MDLGFSTMGDPELSYDDACRLAIEFGLQFLELRILERNLDLPAYFRSLSLAPDKSAVSVRVVSTSFHLEEAASESFEKCLAFAELAEKLDASFIRIFAARDGKEPDATQIEHAAATVQRLRAELSTRGIRAKLLLETHGGFSFSSPCLALNQLLDPPLDLLWDSHHTWKIGGESLDQTWSRLGAFIRHVHYKDSVSVPGAPDAHRYVFPGAGEFPTADLLELLKRENFEGGFSLEWEKLWHPELPPLRQALQAFKEI